MKQMKWLAAAALTVLMWGCGDGAESSGASTAAGQPPASDTSMAQAGDSTVPDGAEIYNNFCSSCHNPGLSGAPKLGDTEAWAPRIAKGKALLLEATIAGVQPAMPPRGMCFDCSDEDLAAAVDYMVSRSQ